MLNFSGNAARTSMRSLLDRYKKSPLRDEIEINEGVRPGAWFPWKFLPVQWIDVNTNHGVVLNKGTIVSTMGALSSLSGTVTYVSSSGWLPITLDPVTGAVKSGYMTSSMYGYEDTIASTLVPANGGHDMPVYYNAADVTVGTFKPDGSLVTAAGSGSLTIPANKPVGIVYQDVYQDNRGRWLNGTSMDYKWVGIQCDGYITLPFVDAEKFNSAQWSGKLHADGYTFGAAYYTGSARSITTESGAYPDVKNLHAFVYTISGVAEATEGCLLTSDLNGKFLPQYSGGFAGSVSTTMTLVSGNLTPIQSGAALPASWVSGTITATGTVYSPDVITEQTVGRLIEVDFNFPKHNLEYVDTYPGSNMPGTSTLGLPNILFEFAYDAAYYGLGGTVPDKNNLLAAVKSGVFGMARIQLIVS